MPLVETLGGIAEKASAVHVPPLMRVVFPGLLATCFLYPLISNPEPVLSDPEQHWKQALGLIVFILLMGVFVSALSGPFYMVFEGRILWPRGWLRRALERQQRRVTRMLDEQKDVKATDSQRYNELWYKLRDYPTDDNNNPYAVRPTLFGNILYAYEDYPRKRYNMDSVFYWTRIWMEMEQEKKEEIDNAWSLADGFVSLSAISFLGGLLWAVLAALDAVGLGFARMPLSGSGTFFAGLGSVALGYLFYRISLPFNRENGERFKAIFDLYRDKVRKMLELDPKDRLRWRTAWAYYQYGRVFCTVCEKYSPRSASSCTHCGAALTDRPAS